MSQAMSGSRILTASEGAGSRLMAQEAPGSRLMASPTQQVIEATNSVAYGAVPLCCPLPCVPQSYCLPARPGLCLPVCSPVCPPACPPISRIPPPPCQPYCCIDYCPSPCDPCDPCAPMCYPGTKFKTHRAVVSHDDPQYLEGCRRIVEFMFSMWQNQTMCDVVFMYDGGKILAHKTALAAYSEFLVQRFNDYPPGEVVSIDMTDFTIDIVSAVLNFVYTTEVDLTDKTVGPIMKCSDELGICSLSQICIEYLSNLTVDNAIIFFSIAENYKLEDMRENSFNYICSRFVEVSNTRHFNYLPIDRLLKILSDDRLNVQGELDVFYAALRWVDHNRGERVALMPKLLREAIRLQQISPESLVRNVEPLMSDLAECSAAVTDALRFHALNMSDSRLALKSFPKQNPRCYRPT